MQIFNSKDDLRVVVRTPTGSVLDVHAMELVVLGSDGHTIVRAGGEPTMLGLAGNELWLRKRDGGELTVSIDWGSLVAAGHQARIVVQSASVRYVEPLRVAV